MIAEPTQLSRKRIEDTVYRWIRNKADHVVPPACSADFETSYREGFATGIAYVVHTTPMSPCLLRRFIFKLLISILRWPR